MFTSAPDIALAVFTADCAGVVVSGDRGVGIAHAGWRGALAGVVPALVDGMTTAGIDVASARIGPSIGPCCFEVGDDVAVRFGDFRSTTSWGTTSVDLRGYLAAQLKGLVLQTSDSCTYHDEGYWSHRRERSPERMAAVAWMS
jgi:copper oxidase (laccase) domain-containing protein